MKMRNDQLKFRCWDKVNKKFVPPSHIAINGNGILLITDSGMYEKLQNKNYCNVDQEYVVQQWTVLKDNFGNEIWEGDIIEFKRKDREGFHKAEIKFVEGAYLAKFIKHEGTLSFFRLLQLNDYCNIKVIGNIFENSELLKQ
jgi:uncharacterized phage protein (TIGR01671 family)